MFIIYNEAIEKAMRDDPSLTLPTDSASGTPANWTRHDIADYPTT